MLPVRVFASLERCGALMVRRAKPLTPADAALWHQLAQTVRPLDRSGDAAPPSPPKLRVSVRDTVPAAPDMNADLAARPVRGASLDGGWDKRLRKGAVRPQRTVDLHGLTQAAAHDALVSAVQNAYADGLRTLLVITGKPRGPDEAPRGILSQRFPIWCEGADLRPYIAALRPASQRHGGSGASYVILRRQR